MKLEEAIQRCNELIKEKHANWIGLSNQAAISTMLQEIEHLQKENAELKEIDLTTVHIKGVCDEKERWRNKIRIMIETIEELLIKITSEDVRNRLSAKKQILQELLKEE